MNSAAPAAPAPSDPQQPAILAVGAARYNLYKIAAGGTGSEIMPWPPVDRRRPPAPQPAPLIVVARDEAMKWAVVALLTAIASGVWMMVRIIPMKHQEIDSRFQLQQEFNTRQTETNNRMIKILERHERRDDLIDGRVRQLEGKQ